MAESVRERLEKRNEERLANMEKKKAEKEINLQPEESRDFFLENFSKEKSDLESMFDKCETLNGDKMALTTHFDSMSEKCQRLQKLVADSTMFLPSHDVKKRQQMVNNLQQAISDSRDKYLPKKKFAFKVRKRQTDLDSPALERKKAADSVVGTEDATQVDGAAITKDSIGFKGLKNQTLTIPESQATNQDIGLSDLEDCTVKLMGPPSAMRMDKLKRCTIISAPVATAIFMDDCESCTFVVACQQLRVHRTQHSIFYLHVTSRAIVEDSTDVGFAPLNLEYADKDRHFKISGLNVEGNNWSLVNDFNWLRKDEQSPNWYLVKESERAPTWSLP